MLEKLENISFNSCMKFKFLGAKYLYLNKFFQALQSTCILFPNFVCPMYIQGPMFILFGKFSRPYVYFLPTSILESRVDIRNK